MVKGEKMAIKKNDFIEIEYTATVKETGEVFDTTSEKVATDNNIYQEGQKFGAAVVCVGHDHVLKGLDEELIGKEPGKEHEVSLSAENAFGKKSAKLVQLIATNKFVKEGITPHPGLQVNVDGMFGIVKTVAGGRTMVDFNHPLSGKDVVYKVKVNKLVTDTLEKAQGLLALQFGKENVNVELKDTELTIKSNLGLTEEYEKKFSDMLHELIPEIKKVDFIKDQGKVTAKSEPKVESEIKSQSESMHETKPAAKEESKSEK